VIDGVRRPWRDAMADALYGDDGLYVASGAPGRHFRTAAHASSLWASAIVELAQRVDAALDENAFTVVDVGAGGGELIGGLAGMAPPRWRLIGCDVAGRPEALPDRVEWLADCPDDVTGLVIACELLDVVPVEVVELTDAGLRTIEVTTDGVESIGAPPSRADREWIDTWWPIASVGDRAEAGRTRDELWWSLTSRLTGGAALLIDYAADPARDVTGTLCGFRDGRQVTPVPDGSCDLTAHVLIESLCRDGDVVTTQHDALRGLGVSGARPAYAGDPASYLSALSSAGDAGELLDPAGLGGFTWLLHGVGLDPASLIADSRP
jgi:SAM-dependent MidA family methyltransferase